MPPGPLIRLERVSKSFDGREILPPVTLTVNTGDFVAVSGPNGGGKTTLLRLMLRLLTPSGGDVVYLNGGRPVRRIPTGYLPQKTSVDSRFPMTVDEVVRSGLLNAPGHKPHRGDEISDAEAIASVMEDCGLTDLRDRVLARLSGGQMQRALLARALVSHPDLLILDEPLSYLDAMYTDRLCDILQCLRGRTTIIVVSHQLETIGSLATRHITVDHGVTETDA